MKLCHIKTHYFSSLYNNPNIVVINFLEKRIVTNDNVPTVKVGTVLRGPFHFLTCQKAILSMDISANEFEY